MNLHKTQIIINTDFKPVHLQTYSTLGPLLINDLGENFDYSDMPDLESVPLDPDPLVSLDSDSDSDDSLPPVFICEYQARAKSLELQKPNKSLDEIKQNIEKTVNFNDISESMEALNNPDILLSRIQNAFDLFKSQTGRTMTYSEMREMMG